MYNRHDCPSSMVTSAYANALSHSERDASNDKQELGPSPRLAGCHLQAAPQLSWIARGLARNWAPWALNTLLGFLIEPIVARNSLFVTFASVLVLTLTGSTLPHRSQLDNLPFKTLPSHPPAAMAPTEQISFDMHELYSNRRLPWLHCLSGLLSVSSAAGLYTAHIF